MAKIAITTVLFLEYQRAKRLGDRRLNQGSRRWLELNVCMACVWRTVKRAWAGS